MHVTFVTALSSLTIYFFFEIGSYRNFIIAIVILQLILLEMESE